MKMNQIVDMFGFGVHSLVTLLMKPFQMVYDYLCWWYFQYIIHLGLSVLEAWEVRIFNSILLCILATAVYTTYLFMPPHISMWARALHFRPDYTEPQQLADSF